MIDIPVAGATGLEPAAFGVTGRVGESRINAIRISSPQLGGNKPCDSKGATRSFESQNDPAAEGRHRLAIGCHNILGALNTIGITCKPGRGASP